MPRTQSSSARSRRIRERHLRARRDSVESGGLLPPNGGVGDERRRAVPLEDDPPQMLLRPSGPTPVLILSFGTSGARP